MTAPAARDSLTAMKRLLAILLITASALLGAGAVDGVGAADAKPSTIVPGKYRATQAVGGFTIPLPASNARIVGRLLYIDYYGTGAPNTYTYALKPTKRGMIASFFGRSQAGQWVGHIDFVKTSYGYRGVSYAYGPLAGGEVILHRVRR